MPTVAPGIPGTPVAVLAIPKVSLTWTAPVTGDPVVTYSIYRSENGGTFILYDTAVTEAYVDAAPVRGLPVEYEVVAANAGGSGPISDASNSVYVPIPFGSGEVHGQMSSTDAHAGTAVYTYYEGKVERDIAADEILMVTDVNIFSAPGGAISVTAVDDPSNVSVSIVLFAGTVAADGGVAKRFETPFQVPQGYTLVVTAPAGQVDSQIEGYVVH